MKKFFLSALIFSTTLLPRGSAAFVIANCVAASNVKAVPTYGGKYDFSMTLYNNCSFLKSDDFNYTGFTFYSGAYDSFNSDSQSLCYLPSFGSTYSFSVGPISAGTYRPYC